MRHPRLYAFYHSKVLNSLMIVVIVSLQQLGHVSAIELPLSCAALAFVLALGYALWLWIRKPERIVVNRWLSDLSSSFALYFIIVANLKDHGLWWDVFPVLCAVAAMFVAMVRPRDEVFDIASRRLAGSSAR